MHLLCEIILLALVVIAGSELPPATSFSTFNAFGSKFRPSQNVMDSPAGPYEYTQYTPSDFILSLKSPQRFYGPAGPPPHRPSHNQPPHDFYNAPFQHQQQQQFYNVPDLRPPHFQKPLFTPAERTGEYPATRGQIDEYNKAVEEELQRLQQQQSHDDEPQTAFANGFTGYAHIRPFGEQRHHQVQRQPPAKSYVDVKFGPASHNAQYQYQF